MYHYLPETPQHYSKIAESGPDGSLFPLLQMLCSLSTEEPLIRARNRVLSDLHDCLNPPNNNRNNYYPQKIKQP